MGGDQRGGVVDLRFFLPAAAGHVGGDGGGEGLSAHPPGVRGPRSHGVRDVPLCCRNPRCRSHCHHLGTSPSPLQLRGSEHSGCLRPSREGPLLPRGVAVSTKRGVATGTRAAGSLHESGGRDPVKPEQEDKAHGGDGCG